MTCRCCSPRRYPRGGLRPRHLVGGGRARHHPPLLLRGARRVRLRPVRARRHSARLPVVRLLRQHRLRRLALQEVSAGPRSRTCAWAGLARPQSTSLFCISFLTPTSRVDPELHRIVWWIFWLIYSIRYMFKLLFLQRQCTQENVLHILTFEEITVIYTQQRIFTIEKNISHIYTKICFYL